MKKLSVFLAVFALTLFTHIKQVSAVSRALMENLTASNTSFYLNTANRYLVIASSVQASTATLTVGSNGSGDVAARCIKFPGGFQCAPAVSTTTANFASLTVGTLVVSTMTASSATITNATISQLIVSTITPTNIVGTTTNNSATVGSVGEYIESVVGAASFPSTGAYGDLTTIALTAGDWDVTAIGLMSGGTTTSNWSMGISVTSGNSSAGLVAGSNFADSIIPNTPGVANAFTSIPNYRMSLAAPATVYFKYRSSYSVGTPNLAGRISARRVR